jgi:hypothetical protein
LTKDQINVTTNVNARLILSLLSVISQNTNSIKVVSKRHAIKLSIIEDLKLPTSKSIVRRK